MAAGLVAITVLLSTGCGGSSSTETAGNVPTSLSTTASEAVGIYEDGPGSCRILEEKHCLSGEPVLWESGMLFLGFSLPPDTPLFAFGGGEAVEMFWSPSTATGDASTSYPGIHVALGRPEAGVVDATVLFMNRDGDPDVHLATIDEGEWIGDLTSEPLPDLPLGIREGGYNLLVWLGDFDTTNAAAYQEYFGLTVEPEEG